MSLRPALRDADEALDFTRAARWYLLCPSFRPAYVMWRPQTICALQAALDDLESEALVLARHSERRAA